MDRKRTQTKGKTVVSRERWSLRTRQQKPEVIHFLNSVKRGRGRPKKQLISETARMSINTRRMSPRLLSQRNVTEENGEIQITFENNGETPPKLTPQTMDIDERVMSAEALRSSSGGIEALDMSSGVSSGMSSGVSSGMSSGVSSGVSSILNSKEEANFGQQCSKYMEASKQFNKKIGEKGLNKTNLMTALKYALIRTNLGNIDLCLEALRLAFEELSVGAYHYIENGSNTRTEFNRTNNRSQWMGQPYTPQFNYNQKSL